MKHWIRDEKRLAIYFRDNCSCVYCGESSNLTLDHLKPRSRGGTNDPRNLVTCCYSCNSSRKDRPLTVWLRFISKKNGQCLNDLRNKIRRHRNKKLDAMLIAFFKIKRNKGA